ncbi:ABC transporter ATP-binding protein [Mycoplasmopsis felifaucium]|uniref:ABC transporter ATP-binding protein n=1 Tax=Mycoplasmopsis felifaucium TaxID=35768 RepID=A0ABZ2RQZ2_9BACT
MTKKSIKKPEKLIRKDRKVSTWTLISSTFKFMGNEKGILIWGIILSFFQAMFYTTGTAMTGFIVKDFLNNEVIGHPEKFKTTLFIITNVAMACCFLLYGVFRILQGKLFITASFKVASKMREIATVKLLNMPISYHDKQQAGNQISTLTNDISNTSQSLVQLLNESFGNIFNIIFAIGFMFVYSFTLSIIVVPISFVFLAISWLIIARARKPYIRVINHFADMNGFVEEMLKNTKVTQTFDREPEANKQLEKIAHTIKKEAFIGDLYTKVFDPWFTIFSNFLVLVILVISITFKSKGVPFYGLIGGEIAALIIGYINLLWNYTTTVQVLFNVIFSVQIGVASTTRIFALLDLVTPSPIQDPEYLGDDTQGSIEFNNVSFRYDKDSEKYQLKNASFYAKPGQTIAIVGPTGAGKTTIINLLSKFYDYEAGSIKIDGIELNKIPKDNLREKMSVVLQDSFMFNDTIWNNLRVSNKRATDKEIIEATTLTSAHNFIQKYENGYDTVIENNGSNLSQGERQLLSLTRAILGNKKILVLDEATSNVDSNTEKIIQTALQESIMKNKTSFVIAHRLSTIRNADLILVVNDGEIIEKGTHRELMDRQGYYYNLHQSQFK